ncbi:MAG: peptidylprolyl isomerase [Pseudomonadota bacterium]
MIFRMIVLAVTVTSLALMPVRAEEATHARFQTSMGDVIVELYSEQSPLTVANFVEYARSGSYDRTIIHRVVEGFVVQGGGYSEYFNERPLRDPVPNESANGLPNVRGAIAMARDTHPDSAQAQWYFNLRDNSKLNYRENDLGKFPGYTVFGHVIDGMDVVDAMGAVETGAGGPFDEEVPLEPILVLRVDPLSAWPAE